MDLDKPFFKVTGLSKAFGGLEAVKNVTFGVKQGSLTSLIGPNGAGKTTVFDLISLFLSADSGRIIFKGSEMGRRKPNAFAASR